MGSVRNTLNGRAGVYLAMVQAVLSLIAVPLLAWILTTMWDTNSRLTRIEANRFTSADGMSLLELINGKADRSDVPPPEVKQGLVRIEKDIRELRHLMEEHVRDDH